MMQHDFFGASHVSIPENPALEGAAAEILAAVDQEPGLLDGETVGEIDRKIRAAVWLRNGLRDVLGHPSQDVRVEAFISWHRDNRRCMDGELLRRARQWLVEHDYIRLPAVAIRDAERQRTRLSRAFGG